MEIIIKNHLNSFNEYLLSSYSVSGTVSNTRDVAGSKMDKKLLHPWSLKGAYILMEVSIYKCFKS